MQYYLAVDIGATSGRHILAHLEDGKLITEEVYRFQTHSAQKHGAWVWECEALAENVIKGMAACKEPGKIPAMMGVSTWGADYVLLDRQGKVLGDAADYRDEMALVNMLFESDKILSPTDYFARTGIGRMPFDTIYQLMGVQRMYPHVLEQAGALLMVPSFINYRLTGVICEEYTNAVTTGLISAATQTWDEETIRAMGFPRDIFMELNAPGKIVGPLSEAVQAQVGFNCNVVLTASHDTTSAFFAVPSHDPDSVTVSSGTWSILGIVNEKPLTTPETMAAGFTNEGAYPKRFRLSKNIVGMFVLEKLRSQLSQDATYDDIVAMAQSAGNIRSVVDLTNLMYLLAEDMAEAIKTECAETGQQVPQTDGEVFRVFFHSLVTHYSRAVEALEQITGRSFTSFNIIGGGSRNDYVNRLAADALGIPVHAGPPEATVAGNLICQMIAGGEISGIEEAADVCAASFAVKHYESGIADIDGIPFGAYARRLRREGIKACQGMAFRHGEQFAVADAGGTRIITKADLEREFPAYHLIFSARANVNAIIRTAPRFCAKAARAGRTVPPVLDDTAQIIGPSLRFCDGSDARRLAGILKRDNACLLRDGQQSGVLAVGRTLEQALAATLIAEKSVQALDEGALIGGAKPLSKPFAWLMHRLYNAGYAKMDEKTPVLNADGFSYAISEKEMALREQVVACGKRLRAANLVQGTWGNISVRLDDTYMLVTPSGLDYERLTPYEIVRVNMQTLEYAGNIRPTTEKSIHAALLLSAPQANCVIHSHSVNCSVFAAAKQGLPVIRDEDRALLGTVVPYSKSAIPGSNRLRDAIVAAMGNDGAGCIMGNHGMLVRGVSIDNAFDQCRAMERAARAYLDKCRAEQADDPKNGGKRKAYEAEIDTPVGRVTARLTIDRAKNPIEGDFSAMNNTIPLSDVVMTADGFTAKTMFKAAFLKLPVDLTCRFDGDNLCGNAETSMGGLVFTATPCD